MKLTNREKIKCLIVTVVISALGHIGCGVKGDPIPPKIPAELGRGQPTYKGATESLAFPTVPPVAAPSATEDAKKQSDNEKK